MVVTNATMSWNHFENIPQFKFSYDTVNIHSQCVQDPPTPTQSLKSNKIEISTREH